jgi:hypothetical protein
MKKLFTLLILSFAYYSNAQVPTYIPSNGLVGYWPFNGNANDESGNGNNGTVNGATLSVDQIGAVNRAYHFNGVNSYISVQNSPSIQINSISQSISFWVKIPSIPNPINEHALFEKMDQNLNIDPTGGSAKGFKISFSGTNLCYGIKNGSGNNWGNSTIPNNLINLNSFQHVVFSNDGSSIRSYLNGVLINTTSLPIGASLGLNTNNFYMGKETWMSNGTPMDLFNGDLDEIGIWSRALTQQEITVLYQGCNVTATITPQSNTTFCQGGFVTLNASTGTNYTYEWYKNGQLINGASSNTYQATTSGSYTVKVIDGACSATSSQTSITVNPLPTAVITPQSSTTFCSGNSVLLNASTANGNTYEWFKNSVLIPSASNSSYSANQSGSYTVKIYNGTCNTTSSATNVTVNPSPTASINTSGSTTFCQGGFVTLTASGGGTYQWNNSSISASINATTGGTYSVIVTNNGCTSTASQLVTVNPNPSVSLTSLASYINNHAPSIQLSGTPSGGTYSGPGVVGSNFDPSTAGLGVKNITYNYTNVNGCVGNASKSTLVYDTTGVVCTSYITVYDTISVTDTLYITTTLGLQNSTSNTFKVYPNPAKDHITIDNGNYSLMNGYSIKIENVIGQTVFSSSINAASFYIDLSNWTGNGVYLLHIKNSQGNDVELRKIVLQH